MAKNKIEKSDFAVIGLGRFGRHVALTLMERDHTVLGIDRNMHLVQELADDLTETVSLDSTAEDALRAVDITLYPTAIVAIHSDFRATLLTTLALKSVGVSRVICLASDESEKTILLKIGADQVVTPEVDSARRLALTLSMPSLLEHLPLGPGYSISDVQMPPSFSGMTVRDRDLRTGFGLTLVAIRRGDQVIISPPADAVYQKGDQVVVIGKVEDLARLGAVA